MAIVSINIMFFFLPLPVFVKLCKLLPLLRVALIGFHNVLDLLHIDAVTLKDPGQDPDQIVQGFGLLCRFHSLVVISSMLFLQAVVSLQTNSRFSCCTDGWPNFYRGELWWTVPLRREREAVAVRHLIEIAFDSGASASTAKKTNHNTHTYEWLYITFLIHSTCFLKDICCHLTH